MASHRIILTLVATFVAAQTNSVFAGGEYTNNFDSGSLTDDFTIVNWKNTGVTIPDGSGIRIVSNAGLGNSGAVTSNAINDAVQNAILKDSVASYKFHSDTTYTVSAVMQIGDQCSGIGFTSSTTATDRFMDKSVFLNVGQLQEGSFLAANSHGANGAWNSYTDVATGIQGVSSSEWLYLSVSLVYNSGTATYTLGYQWNRYDSGTSTIGSLLASGTNSFGTTSEGIDFLSDGDNLQPFIYTDTMSNAVFDNMTASYTSAAVPEPSTWAFLGGIGALGLALASRRKNAQNK
jgi:hypothetical protein